MSQLRVQNHSHYFEDLRLKMFNLSLSNWHILRRALFPLLLTYVKRVVIKSFRFFIHA